ncbi:MAG: hypothetical protein OXF11_18005 [Deltaproteobacteria bacterium]|nr:hypothetical protein [Deltaproteobacteria bacterium]
MRAAREIALGSAFAALFAYVVLAATRWEPETATFPLLIGVVGLGLALWAVAGDALRSRSASARVAGTAEDKTRARAAFAWIAVFFALVLLMGFRAGLPLAVLAYYRVEARVGWLVAVAAALVCAAFLHVAVAYLYLPLYRGVVFQP